MPIVNIKLVEGAFDSDQKRLLLERITDAIESIYPGLRDVTFVTIDEYADAEWSIAGEAITEEKVAAHARGQLGGAGAPAEAAAGSSQRPGSRPG
ncbi:MAG: 4-oxalocrotonate tautomerase family protein [Phycisphaerales bacterium JB039]